MITETVKTCFPWAVLRLQVEQLGGPKDAPDSAWRLLSESEQKYLTNPVRAVMNMFCIILPKRLNAHVGRTR